MPLKRHSQDRLSNARPSCDVYEAMAELIHDGSDLLEIILKASDWDSP